MGLSLGTLRAAEDLTPISGAPVVDPDLCIGCEDCLWPGHCDAITMEDGIAFVHAEDCVGCGICVSLCNQGALAFQEMTDE